MGTFTANANLTEQYQLSGDVINTDEGKKQVFNLLFGFDRSDDDCSFAVVGFEDKTSAAEYLEKLYQYSISGHVEIFDSHSYFRVWHFFAGGADEAKITSVIRHIIKEAGLLHKAVFFPAWCENTEPLPKILTYRPPFGPDSQFADSTYFQAYSNQWAYIHKILVEGGVINPDWLDKVIEANHIRIPVINSMIREKPIRIPVINSVIREKPKSEMDYPEFQYREIVVNDYRNRGNVFTQDEIDNMTFGDRPAWTSHFRFSGDFPEYVSTTGGVRGYNGSCFCDFVIIDIDDNDDPSKALVAVRKLINRLDSEYKLPIAAQKAIKYYFSGAKGFHILIPISFFGKLVPASEFNEHVKTIALRLTDDISEVDESIYDKTRVFRIPSTVHDKSKLRKIPLTFTEINECAMDGILELAKNPRDIDIEQPDISEYNGILAKLLILGNLNRGEELKKLDDAGTEADKWIKSALIGTSKGNRNKNAAKLAGYYKFKGFPQDVTLIHLLNWNKANPEPLPEDEIRQVVKGIYKYQMKDQIKFIRKTTNDPYEKNEKIADTIYHDLLNIGDYIRTDYGYYFFLKPEKRVMNLEEIDFTAFLHLHYGLVADERDFKFVLNYLKAMTHNYGKQTGVYQYCFYDKESYRLYIDKFDGQVYILDGNEIQLCDNGTDGILFINDKAKVETYEVQKTRVLTNLLNSMLIGQINFADDKGALDIVDRQSLLYYWTESIFFESVFPTKPILLLLGIKGSGKTYTAKAIGNLLFGGHFGVRPVSDERDYDSTISNNYLVAFDNVDAENKWFGDRLAVTSTGQVIEKRKLYTTNEVERYYPRCFVMVSSRSPRFRRDDIADRMIILRLERFDSTRKFKSENDLLDEIRKNRNTMLSELFAHLNICIARIKMYREDKYEGTHRMADFASFVWKVSGKDIGVTQLLDRMDAEQSFFLMEHDPFLDCIDAWLSDDQANEGRQIDANTLFKEIKCIAERDNINLFLKSSISLGKKLQHEKVNLQNFFDLQIINRAGASNEYVFKRKTS